MFTKSLEKTPGLTNYQIEYLKTHMNVKKKTSIWVYLAVSILLITTCGVWANIFWSDSIPDFAKNLTHFGVVSVVILDTLSFFVFIMAMMIIKLGDQIREKDSGESAMLIDSKHMMAYQNTLYSFRLSLRKNVFMILSRTANLALIVGMIIQGYIFAPLIVIMSTITVVWANSVIRNKMIDFVKELTPERVTELEEVSRNS